MDDTFISTESDLGTVNRSLESIGISPLKRKDIERTPSYVPRKKQRVQEALSARIDVALSAHHTPIRTPQSQSEAEKIAECLVSKYESTGSRSEKVSILNYFCIYTLSRRRMMSKFGCSSRMATQVSSSHWKREFCQHQILKWGNNWNMILRH